DATPADRGAANINYERKPLAVPGTWNPGTNYADSRYQLPQIDTLGRIIAWHFLTFLGVMIGSMADHYEHATDETNDSPYSNPYDAAPVNPGE
ncbi:hypothetical protein ACL1HL_12600, partial [Corynebacterium striatum]